VLPTLRVSKRYEKMAKDRSLAKETREFVNNSVRSAQWLIESISQRKNTLLRVVNVVLARQRDFLDHGPQHLKPLPMIDVADQLGIHVGTVSRAVADKWLQTPRGLVALRKFFTGGTATDSGQDLSWEAVKAKLKEIVDREDRSRPLSDSELAAELKKDGIDIARRTVVKYRQQLDIPPARRRKTY
jgi:RNA polymerase sigma-54 factor